jgi:hypothetical protein
MPEITDPRLLSIINQQQAAQPVPVQPQPFPGAAPMQVKRAPAKVQQEQIAQTRIGLDVNQDSRAAAGLEMERERLAIAQQEAEAKRRQREAQGGYETTAQAETAAGHAVSLGSNLGLIREATRRDPSASQPGHLEALLGNVVPKDYKGALQSQQRQVVDQSYGQILESMIYMATGAAAQADQVTRLAAAVVPTTMDDGPAKRAKAVRLKAEVLKARNMAGPANIKVQKALDELEAMFPDMYGVNANDLGSPTAAESAQTFGLSDKKQAIPIPPQMQAEYEDFLKAHPPGTLKQDDYLNFYQNLTKKYDFDLPASSIASAPAWVDSYNKAQAGLTIQQPNRDLTPEEQAAAGDAASPTNTGIRNFANSMSLGLPEMLAGREGRFAAQLADEASPKAAMLGDIAGSIAPVVAAEGLVARGLRPFITGDTARRIAAETGANATYGAVRGATGAEPEDRGASAAKGAGIGAGGALGARGLVKGARGFMGAEAREALEAVTDRTAFDIPSERASAEMALPKGLQGLPTVDLERQLAAVQSRIQAGGVISQADRELEQTLTDYLGKSAQGSTSRLPATDLTTLQRAGLANMEEAGQGLPGVHGARAASMASWNNRKGAEILSTAGIEMPKGVKPGWDTASTVKGLLGDGYDKVMPYIQGTIDGDFLNGLAALKQKALAGGGPVRAGHWDDIQKAYDQFSLRGGAFDGPAYKEFTGRLRDIASTLGADGADLAAMDVARAADGLIKQARGLVGRNNPAAGARLKKLDASWAKYKDYEKATGALPTAASGGVATPDDVLGSMRNRDTSPDKTDFGTGQYPGQKETSKAREALGGRPAKRGSFFQSTTGAYIAGGVLGPALTAAYAPVIKRATQFIIDGKLGATPEAVEAFLGKSKGGRALLKSIDGDARQKLLTQMLAAKSRQPDKK